MGSELWKLILGCAIIVAGFATYFVPITLAEDRSIALPLDVPNSTAPLEGTGNLTTRLQFNATLPDAIQDGRYALALVATVEVRRTRGPDAINVSANATVESAQARLLVPQTVNVTEPSAVLNGTTAPLPTRCPCPRARAVFQFDFHAPQNESDPYSYQFSVLNVSVELQPADWDRDGVIDTAQWVPSVPQYYWGFPLTIVGGVILARRFVTS